ncbi:aminoacyl-tRNA hydrolase [bacterium]|nr:aminoacyl-tRNA hydrolase [bacterium]
MIIAGLGNPGRTYEQTRHNVGFRALDRFAALVKSTRFDNIGCALQARVRLMGKEILLIKPMTYMNRSGVALEYVLRSWQLEPEELVVIHDDLDLPIGRLRLRRDGGSGGHKGTQSIIDHLSSQAFMRVRIGIGKPDLSDDVTEYVLTQFNPAEQELMTTTINRAAQSIQAIVAEGLIAAMNIYNQSIE